MARMEYSDFALEETLGKLAGDFHRQVTEKVLYAGGKVLVKEMQNAIEENHHVRSGAMKRSVAMSEVYSGIGSSYVEVGTEGTDSRGVSNAMKNQFINYGRHNRYFGSKQKRDPYLSRLRKRIEPRLNAVMTYQMELILRELGLIE